MINVIKTDFSGGVNQYASPIALKDNEWQQLKNFAPTPTRRPGQRPSLSFAREVEPRDSWNATLYTPSPTSQLYYEWAKYVRPVKFMFTTLNDFAMVVVTTATITIEQLSGASSGFVSVPAGQMLLLSNWGAYGVSAFRARVLGPVAPVSLIQFMDEVYAFSGYDNGSRLTPEPVAYGYQANGNDFGTGNGTFNPTGAAVIRDRVVYYKGSNVYWSDRNEPLVVGSDAEASRGINVSGEEQGTITAVAEISTNAQDTPMTSACAVWTKNRMYMLLGEPGESDATGADIIGTLQITRMNVEAGCVSQNTITRTPYGVFWAGLDDVWFMPFGQVPIRVGTKIRPVLEGQPASLAWKLHAEYSDGFYRLAVFSPGQGPNDYSPCRDHWWLDLTNGPPQNADTAAWYGPQEIMSGFDTPDDADGHGTYTMARDLRANGDGRMYSLHTFEMPGGSVAVYGMSLCTFDTPEGRDAVAPTGTPDIWLPTTAISAGDVLRPESGFDNAVTPVVICTTAGTTGGTEPDWTAPSATGTYTDGSVTWTLRYFTSVGADEALPGYRPDLQRYLNDVEVDILSKEYDFGDPAGEKLLDGAELGYYAADNMRVTYNLHPEQDERSRELYPVSLGTINQLGSWMGGKLWNRKLLTMSPGQRFNALSAAISLQQVPGYVIKTGFNDTMLFTISGVLFTVVIAQGYYTDLGTLITAVTAALNTALGGAATIESTYTVDLFSFPRAVVGWRDATLVETVAITTTNRLAQIFGYNDTRQGTIATNAADPTDFCFGVVSPRYTVCPEFQISTLNLRALAFGRRPQ